MKKIIRLSVLLILILGVIGLTEGQTTSADVVLEPLQVDGNNIYYYNTVDPVMIPTTYAEKSTEFRGVWVATVWNIDFPLHSSEVQYKAAFNDLIDEMLLNDMNAMVFQVRSVNDAWFESDYAPWSRWITGTEGTDPGWDLMTWMIEECHANGIEFHAWLNPYRVSNTRLADKEALLNTLHADNWAKQNPDMVIEADSYMSGGSSLIPVILNPGEPVVKQYIRDVIVEIITDYDVDGIHFDDYFYPSGGTSTDTLTYDTYKLPGQSLAEWRRENVNDVIRGIKEDVDAYNLSTGETVKFGISPAGVWASDQQEVGGSNTSPIAHSSYRSQHADTKRWVEEGWLHYICPQIYRDFEHTLIPYADIVDWWAEVARGTGVDLIIGHALYMDHFNDDEVSTQLRYNQKHPEIKGSLMYSFKWMTNARFTPVITDNWTVTPTNVWESSGVAGPDILIEGTQSENVFITDVTITLTSDDSIFYRVDTGDWIEYTVPFDITGAGGHVVYMKTVDGLGEESLISSRNIPIQYRNLDVPSITITGDMIGDNYVLDSVLTFSSTSETIWYAINHGNTGEWTEYTGPITLDDDGGYFIKTKTIDSQGTESELVSISLTVQQNCFDNPVIGVVGNDNSNDPFYNEATV
ncbi:family 10 glycosylhydrolase, partial [Candidatus Izimaplasma bacterium]|nr:family 10 glycosylhydrolase [Candidatus Izimaplasma bacterium]